MWESDCVATDKAKGVLGRLGRRWIVLSQIRIGAAPGDALIDHILIHPACGVALMGQPQSDNGESVVALFRQSLERGEFETFFPGYLPVVFVPAGLDDLASLHDALADAFAGVPLLTIKDSVWAESLAGVLDVQPRESGPPTISEPCAAPPVAAPEAADEGEPAPGMSERSELHVDPTARLGWQEGRRGRFAWAAGCLVVAAVLGLAIALPRTEGPISSVGLDKTSDVPVKPAPHQDMLPRAALPPRVAPAPAASPAPESQTSPPPEKAAQAPPPPRSAAPPATSNRAAAFSGEMGSPVNLLQPPPRLAPAQPRKRLQAARERTRDDGPPIDAADLAPPDEPGGN